MAETGQHGATQFDETRWIAVAFGNTRCRCGVFTGDRLDEASPVEFGDADSVAASIMESARSARASFAVSASVNAPVSDVVLAAIRERSPSLEVLRVGAEVPIVLDHRLEDPSTLGQDRALNALAAYGRAEQACVVVDAGTAITVDFVDGEGAFAGGAIAPGLAMMTASLASGTAQLPSMTFELPGADAAAFGGSTRAAINLGVASAARGLLRELLDRYAEAYGAYPKVIATGGDAGVFESTGLVEHHVPDLQLLGIAACVKAMLLDDDDSDT